LRNGFWAGLFVTAFLFFFKPFGTTVGEGLEWRYLTHCVAFGLVTFGVTLLMQLLCRALPAIFNEREWRSWKEILFNLFFLFCIGLANMLLGKLFYKAPVTWYSFLMWQVYTVAVGIFPTVFGAFLSVVNLQKKYAEEAAGIHPEPGTHTQHHQVTLYGENQQEMLQIDVANIAFLEAQDNYVQVNYFEQGMFKRRLLRTTMRKMEDSLKEYDFLFRCHRTYLVNFDLVERVSGNAQGYRLHLSGIEETIPVSRGLNAEVKKRLE
jgi:hypothetical protein